MKLYGLIPILLVSLAVVLLICHLIKRCYKKNEIRFPALARNEHVNQARHSISTISSLTSEPFSEHEVQNRSYRVRDEVETLSSIEAVTSTGNSSRVQYGSKHLDEQYGSYSIGDDEVDTILSIEAVASIGNSSRIEHGSKRLDVQDYYGSFGSHRVSTVSYGNAYTPQEDFSARVSSSIRDVNFEDATSEMDTEAWRENSGMVYNTDIEGSPEEGEEIHK